jgi:hypothetical protein
VATDIALIGSCGRSGNVTPACELGRKLETVMKCDTGTWISENSWE